MEDSKTEGMKAVQFRDDVIYGNPSLEINYEATEIGLAKIHSGENNTPVVQQDDNGVGLATLTPKKQESKKRLNSRIHPIKTPRKKLKKHKPKILDESTPKKKTCNIQASGFTPKTPLTRSTPMQRSKKSYVKNKISKEILVKKNRPKRVFDSSKDVVREHLPNSSCKRALRFLEKEIQEENVCNNSKECEDQLLNFIFDKEDGKQFLKHYQLRGSVRTGVRSVQDTQPSSHVVCKIFETDCLTMVRSGFGNISSFPKSYKRRRSVRHLLNRRPNETTNDCRKSLPSYPLECRKKRSPGCTKRRIYASRHIKFKCSSSPSINLLEHLTEEKHHHKLANKTKEMKKRHHKLKPSLENEIVKAIEENLSQDCLLQENDLNMHGFVDFIAKFKALGIHHKHDQLVVRDQSASASIVRKKGKFNPSKKNKKTSVKVDLDEESERAWLKLIESYDDSYENEEYWDKERQVMINRAESTISILGGFQGNRRFSSWKGSVMDSIIGTYLTQNVTDHLSSSAFMDLMARFPLKESVRSNKSTDRVSTYLSLDVLPKEDVGMQRCGNKSTFQEINHTASKSVVISASTSNNQDSEIESFQTKGDARKKKMQDKKNEERNKDWDKLRIIYDRSRERNDDNMDAIDWESVRHATIAEVADTIKKRGMNYILADKIKAYLDRAMRDHGSINLEWLRDVPPKDAKDYLLSIDGIGLKSEECIRLLTLHHVAFPVDANVGRVAVRLGWVPLQPLPEGLEMHLLEKFPVLDNIQKYLYPRLCTLSHETLYELHYHLITFGKIFCTKKKPRCDECPLRGQCKHYASLCASKRLALPASEIKKKSNMTDEPIVELPVSPENHIEEFELPDIEDFNEDHTFAHPELNQTPMPDDNFQKSNDDIPTIRIENEECKNQIEVFIHGENKSYWVVQPGPVSTHFPNYRGRLKSVHQVYELPDSHQILQHLQVDERDPKDPSPYLFAPWEIHEEGGKSRSSFPQGCSSLKICHDIVCYSTFGNNEESDFAATVSGTLMIPVRSANKGRFALNGTYFQVNEVFADDESTNVPIIVPKQCLSDLPLTLLFCGATVTSTFKELPMKLISGAFSRGYFCNRGFDRVTGLTTKLSGLFHIKTNPGGKKTRHAKEKKKKPSDVA